MDLYQGIAERYDLSFGQFGSYDPMLLGFFRQLFTQNEVHTVLDCACGTGRHLPLFQSLGCQVFGSDVSEAMLAQARINLAQAGVQVPLFQADFRELPTHFQQQFDAVVCLAAIGFMTDEMEFMRAFKSMYQVLTPGGILVLTVIPTDRQWKARPRYILTSNTADFSRIFAIDYLENKARYNILDVFHSSKDNDLKTWSAELHVLLRDDQDRLLRSAGFRSVEYYGALDMSPYDKETSNSLITTAFK